MVGQAGIAPARSMHDICSTGSPASLAVYWPTVENGCGNGNRTRLKWLSAYPDIRVGFLPPLPGLWGRAVFPGAHAPG